MSETRIKTGGNSTKGRVAGHHRISVAPMMDWTDRAGMLGRAGSYKCQKFR